MLNEGMSIADAMALKDDGGMFGGSNSWIFFLFFLLAWGNGGFGGGNGNLQGSLTRAEMYDGFNSQDIKEGIRGLSNGLCDGFYALNTSVLNGFNGVDRSLCQGFAGVNSAIRDLGYQAQSCCYNSFMAA